MLILSRLFLLISFLYTAYYTFENHWIRDYMYFGICPYLPALLLITQLMNFINIVCCIKCCCCLKNLLSLTIYMTNYVSYFYQLCYDDYDRTIPELIKCFEFNLLMQTIYIILFYL